MYAVVKTGGKQYKVSQGDIFQIERLKGEVGDLVELTEVLMVGNGEEVQVGRPFLPSAKVKGEIVEQGRKKKIIVFKFKRRKGYHKKQGHHQLYTAIEVKEIEFKLG